MGKTSKGIYGAACREYEKIYVQMFDVDPERIRLRAPATTRLVPPATIGQTIALDLNVSWWKKWFRGFRAASAISQQYADLVVKETDPILSELTDQIAPDFCDKNLEILRDLLAAQRHALLSLADQISEEIDDEDKSEKMKALELARAHIDKLAA